MLAMRIESRRRSPLIHVTFALVCIAIWHGGCPTAEAGRRLEIPAWSFDRGNGRVVANPDTYADYRDMHPELVVVGGDRLPWEIDYDVALPVDATYTLKIRYGSAEPRPIELWLDGRKVATCCGRVTGYSPPYLDRWPRHDRPRQAEGFHGVEWEKACTLPIAKGKHTVKLTRKGPPPRVSALRLESSVDFPGDWKPTGPSVMPPEGGAGGLTSSDRYGPRGRYDQAFGQPDPKMNIDRIPPVYRSAFLPPGSVNVATLRMAIEDMNSEFGPRYPQGPQYLKQLAALEKKQRAAENGTPEQKQPVEDALATLRRQAMLAHPLLKFDKPHGPPGGLLFVKRFTNSAGHIYEDHYGGRTMGGNLCILSPVAPGGKVTEIAPQLAGGLFDRFDLSFDAKRVVFAYKKDLKTNYRIYEIGIDPSTGLGAGGKGLRQLTFDSPDEPKLSKCYGGKGGRLGRGYDDIDPCYLPSGKIMFASTRPQRVVFCFGTSVTTLHVMDGDGKNLHSISEGPITEVDPCVMDDGRVIYMRWEYVDKGFGNVQSLWSMHPDGSGSAHVYKNNVVLPAGMVDPRGIPSSSKIVTIAAAHCGLSVGPVVLVDNRFDRRTGKAMTNITPEIALPGMMQQRLTSKYGHFKEPYALSEKLFLVAHNPHKQPTKPKGYGIYVLDAWGNRAELYRDPDISCFQPVPLRPRRRPTEIPSVIDAGDNAAQADKTKARKLATLFMQDVYQGMTGIKRGRVKYVRVMEALALPWESAWRSGRQGDSVNLQASAVSLGGDVQMKKVYGVVPVYEDGSACFTVPSEKNLFFQALDENYMELQRMRTFVNLMPGEKRSCIGCHELRRYAPGLRPAAAARRPAQALVPQPGDRGPRMVHYALDVQPVLDKHCVRCHGGKAPKGKLDLSGELTRVWNRSYEGIINKNLVSFLYGCYGEANIPAEPPLTFGSHRSKLVERIRKDPCKGKLTREEFIKIVTWIDANAPYYGTHRGKKTLKWKNEPDFRPVPLVVKH